MFGKYTISLNRVHDTVRIREGGEALELRVDADPMRMVAGLNTAQKMLRELDADAADEKARDAARYFAGVIFGEEQAEKLWEFYRGDGACVVSVCGQYFTRRLHRLIERAQKRAR